MEKSAAGVFIGFDFGTRNIGVAVGQKITNSSTALPPLLAKLGIPNWQQIDTLIKEWQPTALVVGVPYKIEGGDFYVTKLAKRFIEQLKTRYKTPVYSAEERLTTKSAREEIFARGGYKALQKQSVDSAAARLILEEWMWQ